MDLDRSYVCLCCNDPVMFSSEEWAKCSTPVALCEDCDKLVESGVIPWYFVRIIGILRYQIASLFEGQTVLKKDIERLFKSHTDLKNMVSQAEVL